jgi:hypothetical protein
MSSNSTAINYLINLQLASGSLDYSDLRKIEMTFMKLGNVIERVFPNSDAAKIMETTDKIIMMAREAQMAIRAVQLASGPIGWAFAAVSVVSGAVMGYGMLESLTGQC